MDRKQRTERFITMLLQGKDKEDIMRDCCIKETTFMSGRRQLSKKELLKLPQGLVDHENSTREMKEN